eukprot:6176712-Pleurochrysis_carterae.AAC.3
MVELLYKRVVVGARRSDAALCELEVRRRLCEQCLQVAPEVGNADAFGQSAHERRWVDHRERRRAHVVQERRGESGRGCRVLEQLLPELSVGRIAHVADRLSHVALALEKQGEGIAVRAHAREHEDVRVDGGVALAHAERRLKRVATRLAQEAEQLVWRMLRVELELAGMEGAGGGRVELEHTVQILMHARRRPLQLWHDERRR